MQEQASRSSTSADPIRGDAPLHRVEFKDMMPDDAEAWLTNLRERRMRLQVKYEEGQKLRAEAAKAKMLTQLDRVLGQLRSNTEKADKAITKAEGYINKYRALAIQIENEG